MAAKPFIARTGLCSLAAGVAATLALAVGTLNDAAARIGFYADTTVSAEKLAMVVGGVSGPTYTRSGSAVNVSVPGSLTATSIVDSGLTSGRITFATTGGALTDSANLTYGSGKVTIADGTASSSTSTGALVLSGSGGIGVGGNAWIGGTINVAGTATVGAGSGNALAILAGAAGSNRFTRVYSGAGTSSANLRWDVGADGTAESGSNAGSPFLVVAYSDSGAFIDSPISIVRASGGTMTLSRPVSMSSTLAVTGGAAMVQTTGLSQASFTIDDGSGSGGQSRLLLFTNSGAGSKTNWRIGAQITLNHTLEIGHSTAVGGSTYTTDLTIDNSGNVAITATTASMSTTTGAEVIAGGLGVGGDLNVGATIAAGGLIRRNGTASTDVCFATYYTSSAFAFFIAADGTMNWGPSTGAVDTFLTRNSSHELLADAQFTIASGSALKLGNAYVATPPTCTGYVTVKDSTGTTYKLLCAA